MFEKTKDIENNFLIFYLIENYTRIWSLLQAPEGADVEISAEKIEDDFERFLKKNPLKYSIKDANGNATSQNLVLIQDYFERTDGEGILTENTEDNSYTKQIISRHLVDIPPMLQVFARDIYIVMFRKEQ